MDLLQNLPIPYYILTPGAHAKTKNFNNCAWDATAALKSNS